MSKWTKDSALQELDSIISGLNNLNNSNHTSPEHVRWQIGTARFLGEVFGQQSSYYIDFCNLRWMHCGTMLITIDDAYQPGAADARYDRPAYAQAFGVAKGILLAARDELANGELTAVYHGKDTPPEASAIVAILNLVEHKMRKLVRDKPSNEKTVQDIMENMFIAADVNYSRESDSIEYSSKTYVPDFTVKTADLAIEVKLCGNGAREKAMIAEINDDILAYSTKYGNLLFVVYDCGFIRDVERFAVHFEASKGVLIRVIKH